MSELCRITERADSTQIQLGLSEEKPNVSRLWALTLDMRIGSILVKAGGVAGVGTDETERGHGYASLVVAEATRFFADTNHDIAVLYGIPDFYHRFGYIPVLPVTTVFLELKDVLTVRPPAANGFTTRAVQPDDWLAVLNLYEYNNAARSGTLKRPRATWQGYRRGTQWEYQVETMVVTNGSSEVIGYAAFDDVDNACRVAELGYQSAAVFPTLLATMIEKAQRCRTDQIEIHLPPDHPFARFCRTYGCRVVTTYQRNQDGMARIINARSLLEKLTPLLTERAAAQPEFNGSLALQTEEGAVTLAVNDGHVTVTDDASPAWTLTLPQAQLAQLVMGYRGIQEINLDEGVEAPPAAIPLIDVLFPVGQPWMACTDYF